MRGNRRRQSNQEIELPQHRMASYQYAQENQRWQYMNRGANRICNYCKDYHHSQSDKCYFLCLYCHSIHFKKSMVGSNKLEMTICPMIKNYALQQQNKKAFDCESCGGVGSYQKRIQTNFVELQPAFCKRMTQYEKMKSEGRTSLIVPQRKIFEKRQQSKIQQCERCNGKGKIYKMAHCCQNGCPQCAFSKIKVSKKWKQIRAKGEDNDQIFPCRICSKEVLVGDKIFKMECGHTFHRGCIFSWLYVKQGKQGCYTCSQVDPYLIGYEFPREYLNQRQFIGSIMRANYEKTMQKATHNKLDNGASDKNKKATTSKCQRKIDLSQSSLMEGQSSGIVSQEDSEPFYSLSMKRTNSLRENQHEQSDNESLVIVRAPSQDEERGLSLDLSVIIRKQSQDINQNLTENIQNECRLSPIFPFKNQTNQNVEQVIKESNQFQDEWYIQ